MQLWSTADRTAHNACPEQLQHRSVEGMQRKKKGRERERDKERERER